MDSVFLTGLEAHALIGVYPSERHRTQPLLLDLEMAFDNRPAAASDALSDTLDYAAIAARLRALVAESRCELLETLAERCAQVVLDEFGVRWLRLRVRKPEAAQTLGCAAVGIVIERARG